MELIAERGLPVAPAAPRGREAAAEAEAPVVKAPADGRVCADRV
jgi:hypothetical protein